MYTHKDLLPPLEKPKLSSALTLYNEDKNIIYTNVDGAPYFINYGQDLSKKKKFYLLFEHGSEETLYTIKNNSDNQLEAKIDKTISLTDRKIEEVKDHYEKWGMKKEADRVKTNYMLNGYELNINGKLSLNQVFSFKTCSSMVLHGKITKLEKNDQGVINIEYDRIETEICLPVFPYVKNNKVICWYNDMKDVWLRQVQYLKGEE